MRQINYMMNIMLTILLGWFGRGQAGSSAAMNYDEWNSQYLLQPARKQKDTIDPRSFHVEGANEYNIWYDKYDGDTKDRSTSREAAENRCVMQTDAGYTKADGMSTMDKERKFFCLHFARGMCAKGSECNYYHRIPVPSDNAICEEMYDCFGRQRHSAHRDDMNGVGSFMSPSRTLYVGNLVRSKYLPPHLRTLEDSLWEHFKEWGELENINLVHKLSIAFPRYRLRASAEFAKEAMTCQTLDHKEVLSIRWAKDDPNPVAKEAMCAADKDALTALLEAKSISTQPVNVSNYDLTQQMMTTEVTEYPDTDKQYGNSSTTLSIGGSYHQGHCTNNNNDHHPNTCIDNSSNFLEKLILPSNNHTKDDSTCNTSRPEACAGAVIPLLDDVQSKKRLLASIGIGLYDDDGDVEVDDSVKAEDRNNVEKEVHDTEKEKEWTTHIDPHTGGTFYYNANTKESSWDMGG